MSDPANTPQILAFRSNDKVQYRMLDLDEFALCFNLENKRVIEKMAAQFVVRQFLNDESAEIFYEESGRPYLSKGPHISVSHSHNWLAVLFSENKEAGIDIEKVRPKILNIRHKYLSKTELKYLENATLEEYTTYWCVKEAVYKACGIRGLDFSGQLFVEPFIYSREGGKIICRLAHGDSEKKYTLQYAMKDDFVLVFTVDQGN